MTANDIPACRRYAAAVLLGVMSLAVQASENTAHGGGEPAARIRSEPPARPDVRAQLAAMNKVSFMLGEWEGSGWVMQGQRRVSFRQTESVRSDLGGLIVQVDGRGFVAGSPPDAKPVFEAFGVISYDDRSDAYEFRSYANGYASTSVAEALDEGGFQWQTGPVRYRVWLDDDGNWFEIGERRSGGNDWVQFFEMTLTRID